MLHIEYDDFGEYEEVLDDSGFVAVKTIADVIAQKKKESAVAADKKSGFLHRGWLFPNIKKGLCG